MTTLNLLHVITEKLKLLNHEMEELKVDFLKLNTDDDRKTYYVKLIAVLKKIKAAWNIVSAVLFIVLLDSVNAVRAQVNTASVKKQLLLLVIESKYQIIEISKLLFMKKEDREDQIGLKGRNQNKLVDEEDHDKVTDLSLRIHDSSIKGIKENVLVKISKFLFPVDFIILDIMEDENIPIILGRPMLETAHIKIDVYGKKISLGVGQEQVVFKINKKESPTSISPIFVINEFDKMQEFDNLVMNDEKKGDFESYLSPEYGSQDIISLSPSKSAEINEDSSMTLCDPDKRMSIGFEDFVDTDDMWDDLDPGILTNEKAKTEFLKAVVESIYTALIAYNSLAK
ncbi:putative reverse transcriptase domain-containing protein [Tanacetum coccineum]